MDSVELLHDLNFLFIKQMSENIWAVYCLNGLKKTITDELTTFHYGLKKRVIV